MTFHERLDEVTGARLFLHNSLVNIAFQYDGVLAEIIEAITGLVLDVESSNIKSSTRIFAVILSVLTLNAAKKTERFGT